MNDNIFDHDDGSTPLTEEESRDLIPSWIITRNDLNAAEGENIAEAQIWTLSLRRKNLLEEKFFKDLHKKMFYRVWRWAGKFRQTERNIGVMPREIVIQLRLLLQDTKYWIENKTFSEDEIAVRFHHRLVWIHPFPNGNGRHARMMTDLLLENILKSPKFSWGQKSLEMEGEARTSYIKSLREADERNYRALLKFVRS